MYFYYLQHQGEVLCRIKVFDARYTEIDKPKQFNYQVCHTVSLLRTC